VRTLDPAPLDDQDLAGAVDGLRAVYDWCAAHHGEAGTAGDDAPPAPGARRRTRSRGASAEALASAATVPGRRPGLDTRGRQGIDLFRYADTMTPCPAWSCRAHRRGSLIRIPATRDGIARRLPGPGAHPDGAVAAL
jgi:hypothetical protein